MYDKIRIERQIGDVIPTFIHYCSWHKTKYFTELHHLVVSRNKCSHTNKKTIRIRLAANVTLFKFRKKNIVTP